MALNSTHPSYDACIADWELMRHCYGGEGVVKAYGVRYLPATPGQVLDGALGADPKAPGFVAYAAYKMRAVFPDYVSEAVERFIGMLHHKEAVIELPPQLEPLRHKATIDGESLLGLLRRINEQQLVTGRQGLLLDFPVNPDPKQPLPYIALYYGESVRNWDNSEDHQGVNGLTLVVLDESGPVRSNDFTWVNRERYRVLKLGTPSTEQRAAAAANGTDAADDAANGNSTEPDDATEGVGADVYMQGVFEMANGGGSYSDNAMFVPVYRGKALEQVPFVFVNSKDITPNPDNPPLLGLGRLCMAIYRGEADYRHTLFMQGQDTLVTIGTVRQDGAHVTTDDPLRVGAGAHIGLDVGGDAKYVGIGADGITGLRESLNDDRKAAEAKAGTMISPGAGKQESGDAMTTRVAAQAASLTQIAQAGAMALQNVLRIAAEWMGADPEAVVVQPNLEFATIPVTGQEITQLMAARTMGAPISLESIHGVAKDRGLAKFDFDTELEKIEEEDANRALRMAALPQPPAPAAPPAPPAPAPKGGA